MKSARHMFARSRLFLICWRKKGSVTWRSSSARWIVTLSPSRAHGQKAHTPRAVSHFSAISRSSIASASALSARAVSPTTSSRSEEHTSELQSLMRISYAVFCLKKKRERSDQNKSETQNHTQQQRTQNTHE